MKYEEIKILTDKLIRCVNCLGKDDVGTIDSTPNVPIYIYEKHNIRFVVGKYDYNNGAGVDNRDKLEVTDLNTNVLILSSYPQKSQVLQRAYSYYKQVADKQFMHPDYQYAQSIVDNILEMFNIKLDDFVVESYRDHRQVYKIISLSKVGKCRYVLAGQDKDNNTGYKCSHISCFRKATQEDLQLHYNPWKEIAERFDLT